MSRTKWLSIAPATSTSLAIRPACYRGRAAQGSPARFSHATMWPGTWSGSGRRTRPLASRLTAQALSTSSAGPGPRWLRSTTQPVSGSGCARLVCPASAAQLQLAWRPTSRATYTWSAQLRRPLHHLRHRRTIRSWPSTESSGTQLWFRATGGPPTLQPPTFIDVATADTGHVYIAGWNNPQSAITTLTLSVRQYDLAGNVGWIGGYGQSTEFNQAAVAVTVDTLGNIYVAGWAAPRFSADVNALVVRFDTAGNRLWVQTLPADVFGGDRPTDVAADAQGTVYIVGAATILAFDSAGTQLWAHQIGDPSSDLIESAAVDASDALYLAGTTTGAILGKTPLGQEDAFLVKLVPPSTRVGYYEIVSRNSDKCLDVYGASTEAAASVIQWTCHGGENQQWRLEPADDGAFRVVARHSGQVLDVYAALVDDRTPIIQYPSHGGDNQLWTIEPTSDGYVRIVARHTGKLLDVEGASIYDGAQVIQYTGHGGANQQWLLRAVVSTAALVTTASDRDQ